MNRPTCARGCCVGYEHVHSEAGVDREYVCTECGARATDRWDARGRHTGDVVRERCPNHTSGIHFWIDASTRLPLGAMWASTIVEAARTNGRCA
jgi:hypothetical protein